MNTSNLHAANATSVVGNAISIPPRTTTTTSTNVGAPSVPTAIPGVMPNAAAAAAAAAAQLQLNQMRAVFKPAVSAAPVTALPIPTAASTQPIVAPAAPVSALPVPMASAVVVAVAAASPAVPNTAGAGALNLSGRWYLDRDDSDSTNDYLEAMGLPLIARQAADKLDLMVIINQSPGDFIITRRTRIFTETKHLKFGQEVNVKGNLIKIVGDATHLRTVTQLSAYRGVIVDNRTLDEQGRMVVDLTLQLPDRTPVVTRRYFKKTSDSVSLDNLPPFDISLETAGDVKRKR